MTDLITARSVRFIEQNAARPFFIDVAYNAAHWPYQRPDHPSFARDRARHLGPLDDSTSTRADYVAVLEPLLAAWQKDIDEEAMRGRRLEQQRLDAVGVHQRVIR